LVRQRLERLPHVDRLLALRDPADIAAVSVGAGHEDLVRIGKTFGLERRDDPAR
jgi:hypothetical protein